MGLLWKLRTKIDPKDAIRSTIIKMAKMEDSLYDYFSYSNGSLIISLECLCRNTSDRVYLARILVKKVTGAKIVTVFDNVSGKFDNGEWVQQFGDVYEEFKIRRKLNHINMRPRF